MYYRRLFLFDPFVSEHEPDFDVGVRLAVNIFGFQVFCLHDEDGQGVLGGGVGQADQQLAQLELQLRVQGFPVRRLGREVNLTCINISTHIHC